MTSSNFSEHDFLTNGTSLQRINLSKWVSSNHQGFQNSPFRWKRRPHIFWGMQYAWQLGVMPGDALLKVKQGPLNLDGGSICISSNAGTWRPGGRTTFQVQVPCTEICNLSSGYKGTMYLYSAYCPRRQGNGTSMITVCLPNPTKYWTHVWNELLIPMHRLYKQLC